MPRTTGRAAFLQLLVDEGVTHLFGNPGTTELAIMEVVPDFPQLDFVLRLAGSVVMAMADGYCRASGRLAAANVHVMPGLGNAMGALYNAKFSGSPVILTAGQQEQGHGLLEPMLYEPLVQVAQPLVKWAVEVTRAADLPRIIHRAAKIALTPPTGPVFLSLPGDVLDESRRDGHGPPSARRRRNSPIRRRFCTTLLAMLLGAKHPAILAGQELATRDAFAEATELAELLGAAVFQSSIPYSAQFPTEHPAFMGALTRQQKQVRATLEPLRPAPLPRRRPPAHVGLQPGRAAAREPAGDPRLRAPARARQELPHRPRGAGRRQANSFEPFAFAAQAASRRRRPTPRRAQAAELERAA